MVGDLTEKIQASQNKFEQLVAKLPGYSGYKAKEQRREADKMLRLHVARGYEEQLRRLNDVQLQLTQDGQLRVIVVLERAVLKLQLLIDRLRNASYGYAGLFDAVKVDEEVLDRLYDFDETMLEAIEQIKGLVSQLEDREGGEPVTLTEANGLVNAIQELNYTFSHRQDVLLG